MIITDQFVVLNNPKTGSSFVREVLKELYRREARSEGEARLSRPHGAFEELMLPNIKVSGARPRDQHGTFEQIPAEHRGKTVVSVVRDPYERLLSDFTYRFWEKYPPLDRTRLKGEFPEFPDLSLDQFLRLRDLETRESRLPGTRLQAEVGYQTVLFIQMFFRSPEAVLRRVDDRYLDGEEFLLDLPDIAFLRTESLNRDLYEFLRGQGYRHDDVAFILSYGQVNVGNRTGLVGSGVWTDGALRYLRHNERLLFRILDHKQISYPHRPL
jgi:hypothetical protein